MREYLVLEDSRVRLKLDSVGKAKVGARNWRGKMEGGQQGKSPR
jgi:hypothetical protein